MKLFYKINLLGLLLGFVFYLICIFSFSEYDIQQALKLSKSVFATISLLFYLLLLISTALLIPIISDKWLKGTKWSLILSVLWIPYLFFWIVLINKLFPPIYNFIEDDYGAGLFTLFLIIGFPIYIFILNLIGIFINKNRQVT